MSLCNMASRESIFFFDSLLMILCGCWLGACHAFLFRRHEIRSFAENVSAAWCEFVRPYGSLFRGLPQFLLPNQVLGIIRDACASECLPSLLGELSRTNIIRVMPVMMSCSFQALRQFKRSTSSGLGRLWSLSFASPSVDVFSQGVLVEHCQTGG